MNAKGVGVADGCWLRHSFLQGLPLPLFQRGTQMPGGEVWGTRGNGLEARGRRGTFDITGGCRPVGGSCSPAYH